MVLWCLWFILFICVFNLLSLLTCEMFKIFCFYIYLFSWRQILNHFSFQKTGWGFSIYNIVSLIKSLTDDSAQIRNQWWRNVFLFMNVNELVNVLEVSGTNVAIKSCIVPWMILNICIWNKSYNRLISVMTVVVII